MTEEVFEDGKQVEDYVAALSKTLSIPKTPPPKEVANPTNLENTKTQWQPLGAVAEIIPAKIKPPLTSTPKISVAPSEVEQQTAPSSPLITNPPLEPVTQASPTTKVRRSFDDVIEEMGEKKKQMWIENAYKGIVNKLMELDNPQPPQQQTQSLPPPSIAPVIVKDNSEAIQNIREEIKRLDLQIIDPNTTNILPLQIAKETLRKQQAKLEGIAYIEPSSPVSSKVVNNEAKTKKGGNQIKVYLAAFAVSAIIAGAVIYLITAVIH